MEEQRKTVWGSAGRGVAAAISCGVRVAGAALVVGTLACANMKAPAEQAVNAADAALASVSGEASTYVPGELKSAQDTLVAAKTSLEHGDYQTGPCHRTTDSGEGQCVADGNCVEEGRVN